MQSRMPIVVALVVGLVAAVLTKLYVDQIRQAAQPETSRVMLAVRDLPPGTSLEARDVTPGDRDTRSLPKLAIRWDERNLYFGQQLAMDVKEGDYILQPYFGVQGAGAQRPSERIDAKLTQRALTIPVTAETSLQESIRPGDRVDLLFTYTQRVVGAAATRGGTGQVTTQVVTAPLLDNVYVLFTGKFGSPATAGYSTVTLLVSPDEAKLLVNSMNVGGKLSILLRNPKDLQLQDRTFLVGDDATLAGLAKVPLRVDEILAERQPKQ
jgi:Flp pilus assembly protein CpaB